MGASFSPLLHRPKELYINYVPEIRNECDVWEQVFRRYCVDPLTSSNADK